MSSRLLFVLSCLLGASLSLLERQVERRIAGAITSTQSETSKSVTADVSEDASNVGDAAYELRLHGTKLNSMELGLDRTGNGKVDQWILSAEGEPLVSRVFADGLTSFFNYVDDDHDGIAEKLVISVGPETSRTEVMIDKKLGRQDWIVTTNASKKYGYTDLDSDGAIDLVSVLVQNGEEKRVIRYVLKDFEMLEVVRKAQGGEHDYVVLTDASTDKLIRWRDGGWFFQN